VPVQVWMLVGIAVVVLATWIAWIRQATVAARLRIWLDPQYRDGKHVARRSRGRHAAAGPEASGVPGLIAYRRALHIRKLAPTTVHRYQEEWLDVQARSSEDPEAAVLDADRLITMVMLDRGYPVDDFERRAPELTARHGGVVANYRNAHAVALGIEREVPHPQQLRRAMACYGELFDLLVAGTRGVERRRAG
jgi:hypothetical protein